jgi:RNA polymerase sigma factor (TIGR02999 family)
LSELQAGDKSAAVRLLPIVYDQLRAVASGYFRSQRSDHTLQPTALVHEAYLRLVKDPDKEWSNRAHFFAVASTAMRQILINHAQSRGAKRHGGEWNRLTLNEAFTPAPDRQIDLLVLDEALNKLTELNERMGRIVELRFFGGLTVEEVAHVLKVSKRTVEGDWELARAWLSRELKVSDRG